MILAGVYRYFNGKQTGLQNIYLINFSAFEEALVLDDLARFEIDIKFLTDVPGQEQLKQFIDFEKFLLSSKRKANETAY